MQRQHWKRALVSAIVSLITGSGLNMSPVTCCVQAQDANSVISVPAGLQESLQLDSTPIQYLPFAHFAIPFDVDRGGRLPSEVHLWVSPDQGKSWLKYATNSPDKRSFEFHAAAEGEYLFAVQTRDDRGVSALAAAPPMRVMVDTSQPRLELSADINGVGRLVIDYRIQEKFLSEDDVHLSYSIDGRGQWEEVRVGTLTRSGDIWSGRLEMEMPRCRELELKLTARDLAQNTGEVSARYNTPRTAAAAPGMQLASQRAHQKSQTLGEPKATGPKATGPAQRSTSGLTATDGAVAWEPSDARQSSVGLRGTELSAIAPTMSSTSPSASPSAAASNSASPSLASGMRYGTSAITPSSSTLAAAPNQPQLVGQTVSSPRDSRADELLSVEAVGEPSPKSLAPPIQYEELPTPAVSEDVPGGRMTTAPTADRSGSALDEVLEKYETRPMSASPSLADRSQPNSLAFPSSSIEVDAPAPNPSGSDSASKVEVVDKELAGGDGTHNLPGSASEAYHSRSRSFSLDYSVESLRGLAIADIELWGTDDRGNTWLKWGSDPDRESPFDVQVGDDGLFGFRMVIIGEKGLVSNRPQDGDAADMWINVDTKMPTVKITRALYGEGQEAGMLVIDYTCDDEHLHDRPITLSFSERPSGPWSTIASGLRNTGIYLWKADPNLPQQVYLRMQAVDRAGNIQEHRLELPINLRGLTPRGRIQGFRPIETK